MIAACEAGTALSAAGASQTLITSLKQQVAVPVVLVPPGVRHGFGWDHRRPSRHGYVHFRPEEVGRRVAARVRLRRMTEHDPLAGLCAHLLWLGREPTGDREDQARRTLRFLLGVFTSGALPDDQPSATLPDPLSRAVEHLRRAWSRMPLHPVRVDELAAATHLSRGYLSRLFHREFGIGIAAALESLRCSRADAAGPHRAEHRRPVALGAQPPRCAPARLGPSACHTSRGCLVG